MTTTTDRDLMGAIIAGINRAFAAEDLDKREAFRLVGRGTRPLER